DSLQIRNDSVARPVAGLAIARWQARAWLKHEGAGTSGLPGAEPGTGASRSWRGGKLFISAQRADRAGAGGCLLLRIPAASVGEGGREDQGRVQRDINIRREPGQQERVRWFQGNRDVVS